MKVHLMDIDLRDQRLAFLREYCFCWCCGWLYDTPHPKGHPVATLDCHEIASGPARKRAVKDRSAWMVACRYCNGHELTDKTVWPIERQLALKKILDPEHYNRVRVNELRGRAPEAITDEEVEVFVKEALTEIKANVNLAQLRSFI